MVIHLAKPRPHLAIANPLGKVLTGLQERLPRVRPWVAIAMLLALGLLGYYSTLGLRYWTSSQQVTGLHNEIRQLSAMERQRLPVSPDGSGPTADPASPELTLEQLRLLFSYPNTDYLVAILSSTAQETQVNLGSVVVGDLQSKSRGELKYQAQPMSITIQGQTTDIYRFFSRLQQKVPVAALSRINMANLESTPVAQAQLLFYLSPEAIAEKERAK